MTIQNLIEKAHYVGLDQKQMIEMMRGNYPYAVTGKSKFMSGWGPAAGKAAWDVVLCRNQDEVCKVMSGLHRDGDIYITRYYSDDIPFKSSGRIYSVRCAEDCHAWLN